jgi:hypothetical protein
MENDVTTLLLSGLSKQQFIAYFIWAFAGWLLSFTISVRNAVVKKNDNKWEWSKFWKGMWRVLGGLISLAAGIIFFEKLAGLMFDSETPIILTAWSSFAIVGLGSERLGKVFGSFIQGKK